MFSGGVRGGGGGGGVTQDTIYLYEPHGLNLFHYFYCIASEAIQGCLNLFLDHF